MSQSKIPLIILGGSDRKAAQLPPEASGHHALAGYKGMDIRLDGEPLIRRILERLAAFPLFEPIWIAGPRRVYEPAGLGVRIIDTDASIGQNLRVAIDTFQAEHPAGPAAFLSCDVLPDPDELRAALEDYERSSEAVIWCPVIRVPADRARLHSFSWKPRYGTSVEPGGEQLQVLPGHLVIGDPRALDLQLGYRMLEIAYRTRNRDIAARRRGLAWGLLTSLLGTDLRRLLRLRAPSRTWTVLGNGFGIARALRRRTMSLRQLESRMAAVAVLPEHRAANGGRPVCFPLLDALSLAEDVDTEEEARDLRELFHPAQEKPAGDGFMA